MRTLHLPSIALALSALVTRSRTSVGGARVLPHTIIPA